MGLPVADVYDIARDLPADVSVAALAAFFLLLPLYFSQRRDLERLRAWMERDPGHPAADLAASESLLDRTETDLKAALDSKRQAAPSGADPGEQAVAEPTLVAPPGSAPPAAARPLPPAQRVTHERPALERITTERAALQPHRRWRRLAGSVGQPWTLSAVAAAAVVLGLVAIFASGELLSSGDKSKPSPRPGAIVSADVDVAVLNGTSAPGLAAKVGDDVRVNGFKLGTVTNSRDQFDQTVVMYEPGQQRAAKKVADDLGVKPVQPIDRQTERAAGTADVVVIAGADRAK